MYVNLMSNVEKTSDSDTMSNFCNRLPVAMNLSDAEYEVAVTKAVIPKNFDNLSPDTTWVKMEYTQSDVTRYVTVIKKGEDILETINANLVAKVQVLHCKQVRTI